MILPPLLSVSAMGEPLRRNVSFSFDEPATVGEIDGSVAARGMQAGEPLLRGVLRREQLVSPGQKEPVR